MCAHRDKPRPRVWRGRSNCSRYLELGSLPSYASANRAQAVRMHLVHMQPQHAAIGRKVLHGIASGW